MPAPTHPSDPPGHRIGSAAYHRITLALFLAGLATFALLYATQPLLPLLSTDFGVSPAQSAWSVSFATAGLGAALPVTLGSLFALLSSAAHWPSAFWRCE